MNTITNCVHCNDGYVLTFFFGGQNLRWSFTILPQIHVVTKGLSSEQPLCSNFLTYGFVNNISFIVRLSFKCLDEEFFLDQLFLDPLKGFFIPTKINLFVCLLKSTLHHNMCACPPQVASYFGHSVAVTDINGDG